MASGDIVFVRGSDSAVRVDQIAAFAECEEGTTVVLTSGGQVIIRMPMNELTEIIDAALVNS